MILLEEAIVRFNTAGAPYGVVAKPLRRRGRARDLIAAVEDVISPLELPTELRAFWLSVDPASIMRPALDGFIPLDRIVERREIDCPPAPSVLLPLADWTHSRIWVELASGAHPGGRIFHSFHDESEVSLWSFGVSGLLDLLSTALEHDLIDDRRGGLHAERFEVVVRQHLDEVLPAQSQRRFEAVDRSMFERHWQIAEGMDEDHFRLRGATHTVGALLQARLASSSVRATLQGRFQFDVGGGPIPGCVGTFSDGSGQLQIYVPQQAAVSGALGQNGEVEIDVVAMPTSGDGLEALTARKDLERSISSGLPIDGPSEILDRLIHQMGQLDTSVVATALRPMR